MKLTRLNRFREEIVRDVVEVVVIDLMILMIPFVYLRDITSTYISIHLYEFPKPAQRDIMQSVSNGAQ